MYSKKTCTFCGKPLPKKIYFGTPQAEGYCSNACRADAERMTGKGSNSKQGLEQNIKEKLEKDEYNTVRCLAPLPNHKGGIEIC